MCYSRIAYVHSIYIYYAHTHNMKINKNSENLHRQKRYKHIELKQYNFENRKSGK